MQRKGRAATRRDVATRAGVAPSTVSLVLNQTPGTRIPPETRQRVFDAAKELGYQSSAIARALVSGRTQTIGVVLHYVVRPFHDYIAGILDGFWVELQGRGYRMLVVTGTRESCAAGLYRERCVDGLFIAAADADADDAELRELVAAGFPAVFVGAAPRALAVDYIDIDNVAAGRRATERLLAAGHRDILHLAGPLAVNSSAVDRRDGYLAALRAAGIAPRDELVIDCSYNTAFAEERLAAALDRGVRFSAVFAANAGMGAGAIRALRRRGIAVPGQVSVVGIDSAKEDSPVPLSTLEQPLEDLGRAAGRLLFDRLNLGPGPARHVLLPCRDVAGQSVAAFTP